MPVFDQQKISAYARAQVPELTYQEAVDAYNAADDAGKQAILDEGQRRLDFEEAEAAGEVPELVGPGSPSEDGIANPESVGDDLRLGQQQDRASQVAIDNQRATINNTERGLPFFEQLKNLVGATDAAIIDSVQDEDALQDQFVEQYRIENNGEDPDISLWFQERDRIRQARNSFEGSDVTSTRYREVAYVDRINQKAPAEIPEKTVQLVGNRLVRYAEDTAAEAREESDGPTYLIDALIYIQGVEVSEFLQGEIRISLNGTQGHNTATFTLENSSNRFTWTERNLFDIHGPSAERANATYIRDIQDTLRAIEATEAQDPDDVLVDDEFERGQLLRRIRFTQQETIKEQIYTYKADPARNPPIKNPKGTISHARFDMSPGRCIFNRMDPIRIFSLYPFRVPGKQFETVADPATQQESGSQLEFTNAQRAELWLPEFTGYVNTVSMDEDDTSGASRITVDCVDFRQAVLRRMRISADLTSGLANPLDALGFRLSPTGQVTGQGVQLAQDQAFQAEFKDNTEGFYDIDNTLFYDDIIATEFNQPFPNKSLEEAIRDVLVPKGAITTERNNRGVRGVQFGGNFFYDSLNFSRDDARAFLEAWHKFCLFGPKRRPWTREEVDRVGAQTTTDGSFAPNNIRLWFLLPIEGSGPRNLSDLSQISMTMNHDVNWTNRQEIIQNFADSIDYNYMVTGTGDIIVEFQMADFRPEDFGEFKKSFRVDKHLISTQIGDEQEAPPAGLIVTTNFAQGHASTGNVVSDTRLTKTFVYSPYIAARYGIEIENESIPFLLASDKKVAQQRAVMLYQRRLARSHAMSFMFSYRPFLLPNRPMHHLRRSRIGSTVTVDKMLSINAQPKGEVVVGLEHIRLFTGHYRSQQDFDNLNDLQRKDLETKGKNPDNPKDSIETTTSQDPLERQVFTTVAAGESTPTSNRVGWSNEAVLAPASGIYIIDLDSTKPVDREQPSANSVDETEAEDVGDFDPPIAEEEMANDKFKFPNNPLSNMTLVSAFGERSSGFHNGIDLQASQRTPIFAVDDGVLRARPRQRVGNQKRVPGAMGGNREGHFIILRTDSGFEVWHMHLNPDTLDFNWTEGQRVTKGQQIAWSGNTGGVRPQPTASRPNAGSHLHMEVVPQSVAREQGRVRDDTPITNQRVDPVPYLPAFSDGSAEGNS